MELLSYRTLDGIHCFINPHHVSLIFAQGHGGERSQCRIHLGRADHFVDVAVEAEQVAEDIAELLGAAAPADPTMNLLS